MREKIIGILICMLMFSTVAGAFTSINLPQESSDSEIESTDRGNTHSVLGEYGTMTTCVPCKYAHRALKYLYENKTTWDLPFYYITYVYDKNNWSFQRVKVELDLQASPTVFWDGGWKQDVGGTGVETEMDRYNLSIRAGLNRNVKDINLSLDVEWLGAVNQVPSNGATGVPVEQIMRWNNSEMKIDVEVSCNETDSYNGHLHVQVTEVESAWYNDKFGDPETFEFKDYAYNNDVSFSGSGTWSQTIYWDGCDHHDKDSPPKYFNHVKQDNIMVIASIFDEDKNNYVDEVTGFLAGDGTDPKFFDVYFGKTNPPPKIYSNISSTKFDNISGPLEFDTTYYWKVDTWNAKGNVTYGDILNFKTRGNDPPNEPSNPSPENNETGLPINVNLTWTCIDPNFDPVTFDVYFGEGLGDPPQVAKNITNTTYDPTGNLNFQTRYTWKIVAWDLYGYQSVGDLWNFKTEANVPPNIPSNPDPSDGQTNVNVEANLSWTGGDPNDGEPIRYDVYFGVTNPPTKKSSNQTETTFDPGTMIVQKTYHWYIVSWDSQGETVTGPPWTFTTGLQVPPTAPVINGPTLGTIGEEYEYTFVSTDENNDRIRYYINWGDGKTEWTGLNKSGVTVSVNHTWYEDDIYIITSKAQDEFGGVGPEAEFEVRMPRNKVINNFILYNILERLLYRFPLMRQILGL